MLTGFGKSEDFSGRRGIVNESHAVEREAAYMKVVRYPEAYRRPFRVV